MMLRKLLGRRSCPSELATFKKAILATATGAIAALIFGVGSTPAHTTHYSSEILLGVGSFGGGTDTAWYGNIQSPKDECRPRRTVKLFEKVTGADTLLGSDKTASDSGYTIYTDGYPPPNGTYYTRVTRKNIGRRGHHHICLADRSNEVLVAKAP
jgi:hypothetical protein